MATAAAKPTMPVHEALAYLLRRGGATVRFQRGKEVPKEKLQVKLAGSGSKIKRFTEDWNKNTLSNMGLPDPVFVKDPNDIITIDTAISERTVGNYDYDVKLSDKTDKRWKVRTDLQIGFEEFRREPLSVSLVRCLTETFAETHNMTLPPFYHLGRDLLETCGFGPENGFYTTNMLDASNALQVNVGDEIALTSVIHVGAWDPTKAYPDLAVFASVEGPLDERATWKNYPEFVGQLMAVAAHNFIGKKIDPDDSVSAFGVSLSGWHARVCTAKFPVKFFEDLEKGQVSEARPEIKIYPSNRGENLMSSQGRKNVMNMIHAKAKQRAGDLPLQLRPWGPENE